MSKQYDFLTAGMLLLSFFTYLPAQEVQEGTQTIKLELPLPGKPGQFFKRELEISRLKDYPGSTATKRFYSIKSGDRISRVCVDTDGNGKLVASFKNKEGDNCMVWQENGRGSCEAKDEKGNLVGMRGTDLAIGMVAIRAYQDDTK